jgi:hypothetical protein
MPGFRHIRAVILVASALALATRAAFPVHMSLAGADGAIYVAMCTATGIKQVPLRKVDGGQKSPGQASGNTGCAHSLCAASVLVCHSVLASGLTERHHPLLLPAGAGPDPLQVEFAYARGPPGVSYAILETSGAVRFQRAALFYG